MTREEAIKAFRGLYGVLLPREYYREAIQMAIEALSREPSEDAVSREAAIDAANKIIERDTSGSNVVVNAMIAWSEYIRTLPSAQPEIIRCKECLWRIGRDCTRFTDLPVYMDDYCGRAKRRGEQDG